jgi:hypothetical protein
MASTIKEDIGTGGGGRVVIVITRSVAWGRHGAARLPLAFCRNFMPEAELFCRDPVFACDRRHIVCVLIGGIVLSSHFVMRATTTVGIASTWNGRAPMTFDRGQDEGGE